MVSLAGLRQASRRQAARPAASTASLPAPVRGWNARDGLDTMRPTDAVRMDNFIPRDASVKLRAGFAEHATGVGSGNVETIASYNDGTTLKLLAAGGGKIYDATSSGAASSLKSGFSANRWQWINFNGSMGLVNGTDKPQTFDGTSVSDMTISGSGLTTTNIIGITAFASRTYFWEDNSQDFWYSAVNSLGGSLTKFQLSRVGQFGGKLVAVVPWTIGGAAAADEAGVSLQQLLAFVMSSGEIIVYRGDDPGTAASWSLVGVYRAGAPLDVRGTVNVAGDALILTRDGLMPMSAIMRQGRFGPNAAITDRIRGAFTEAVRNFGANTGWQVIFYPDGPWLLVNVPRTNSSYDQYVMNTVNGAWTRFTGMNGRSWAVHDNALYFGGTDGRVHKANSGKTDDGGDIVGEVRQAYTDFGRPSLKKVSAIRPVVSGAGDISIAATVESDFATKGISFDNISLVAEFETWSELSETSWDTWDETWNEGSVQAIAKWLMRGAQGTKVNVRLRVNTQEEVEWFSTDFRLQTGQGLT